MAIALLALLAFGLLAFVNAMLDSIGSRLPADAAGAVLETALATSSRLTLASCHGANHKCDSQWNKDRTN